MKNKLLSAYISFLYWKDQFILGFRKHILRQKFNTVSDTFILKIGDITGKK